MSFAKDWFLGDVSCKYIEKVQKDPLWTQRTWCFDVLNYAPRRFRRQVDRWPFLVQKSNIQQSKAILLWLKKDEKVRCVTFSAQMMFDPKRDLSHKGKRRQPLHTSSSQYWQQNGSLGTMQAPKKATTTQD